MISGSLLNNQTELSIWGCGLTGYTLARAFADVQRPCLLIDINQDRVSRINRGLPPFPTMPSMNTQQCGANGLQLIRATTDWSESLNPDHPVHLVCVPTEVNGYIDTGPLLDVVTKICTSNSASRPLYLFIESTIAPNWIDTIINTMFRTHSWSHGIDYHIGSSPRRDWFINADMTIRNTPKIIGGNSPEAVQVMKHLYSSICEQIIEAPDAKHAALTKVIENLFRYRNIVLANQLALAMPEFDIAAVLRLASTKWNMDLYHPSFGIGGYCVPLAKDYLSACQPGLSDLGLAELEEIEDALADQAQKAMLAHAKFEKTAILGLTYAPDLKIHTRAPTIRLTTFLQQQRREFCVHDPYYSPEEIRELTGASTFSFPEDLVEFDTVLLVTGHEIYRNISPSNLNPCLSHGVCIVDNLGFWRDRSFPDWVKYVEVGSANYYPRKGKSNIVLSG